MLKPTCWACTKFADYLRGTPKPESGTLEEWAAWEAKAKEKPIRYWLVEEGLDHLQDFIFWPFRFIRNMGGYIDNRWLTKTHALTSRLKKGEWYDMDTRLRHALFDELVNFVEIEQAWMTVVCSEEDWKKYKGPWRRQLFRIRTWRCPEAGLKYLQWASELICDENDCGKSSPLLGQPTPQALAAKEILELYHWWKEDYPKRQDPMEASGLSAYYDEHPTTLWDFKRSEDEDKQRQELSDRCYQIEQEQEDEDTEMLIRLIKLRKQLWI